MINHYIKELKEEKIGQFCKRSIKIDYMSSVQVNICVFHNNIWFLSAIMV